MTSLIALFRSGTPAEMADILGALDAGMAIWSERKDGAAAVAVAVEPIAAVAKPKKAAGRPKKAAAVTAVMPLPEASEDGMPDAAAYRMPSLSIDASKCIARVFNETSASKDKRYKPAVYRELQCSNAHADGSDMCLTCTKRLAKYAEAPGKGPWLHRLTEEPPSWCHMLGTSWADDKKPKWLSTASSSSASVVSGASAEEEEAVPKAVTTAAKAAKEAEKAAAKAAKDAEKAAKDAEKAAAKAAKDAEKAAKDAEKAAAKTAKAAKVAKVAKKAVAVPAKAETGADPVSADYTLECIDGTMYAIRGTNVHEYNAVEETAGDFVGGLVDTDGDLSIDVEAEEA